MFDCTKPVSLREHLRAVAAVRCDWKEASNALEASLTRFGPVSRQSLRTFDELIDFLLPLKSFTTRFGVLGLGDWSLLVTDMAGEHCFVDALAVSRATHKSAMAVVFRDQHRELHVGEDGQSVREVQSLLDGDRWYFLEGGSPCFWEDRQDYEQKRKRNRLGVDKVTRYFELFTGHKLPDWPRASFSGIAGLQRNTAQLKVPTKLCETLRDLQQT